MVAEIPAAEADEAALLRAAYNLRADAIIPEQLAAEAVAGSKAQASGEPDASPAELHGAVSSPDDAAAPASTEADR
jgi:hypothetical protein